MDENIYKSSWEQFSQSSKDNSFAVCKLCDKKIMNYELIKIEF